MIFFFFLDEITNCLLAAQEIWGLLASREFCRPVQCLKIHNRLISMQVNPKQKAQFGFKSIARSAEISLFLLGRGHHSAPTSCDFLGAKHSSRYYLVLIERPLTLGWNDIMSAPWQRAQTAISSDTVCHPICGEHEYQQRSTESALCRGLHSTQLSTLCIPLGACGLPPGWQGPGRVRAAW